MSKGAIAGFLRGLSLPFSGDPLDWMEAHVRFPHSSRSTVFDREQAPWWNEILREFCNPDTRQIYVRACTGSGKSTALEALSCWIVAQEPGPTMTVTQTDETSAEWMTTRLLPVLRACDPVTPLWPASRHHVKKDLIAFPHMAFLAGGANVSNAQEKSVRNLFLDEAWQYSELIGQFKKRLHDRWDGRTLIVTQGHQSPHALDTEWEIGKQMEWVHDCAGCGKRVRPDWRNIRYEEARFPNGGWHFNLLARSVCHVCPHCEHKTGDTSAERRDLASRSYWAPGPGVDKSIRGHLSFLVPAFSVWWIKWADLVIQWILAQDAKNQGNLAALRDFRMQRLAEIWTEDLDAPDLELVPVEYSVKQYQDGAKLEGEAARFLTVDVQLDHFWAVARVWRTDGTSRLIFCGRIFTAEDIKNLAAKLKIPPNWVVLDAAGQFASRVYDICARFGWLCMAGRGDASFVVKGVRQIYGEWEPQAAPTQRDARGNPKQVMRMFWASDPVKDILANLRNIGPPTWEFPVGFPEYAKHLNSERKKPTVDARTKKQTYRWARIGSRANHFWDCEAMQVALAIRMRIIPEVTTLAEVNVEPGIDSEGETE